MPDRKKDQARILELKSKEKDGTLSYLERIELELLVEEQAKPLKPVVEAGAWEELEEAEEGKSEGKLVEAGPKRPSIEEKKLSEEFEVVPVDEEVEEEDGPAKRALPPKRPVPQDTVDPDQARTAVAFGAGAVMGYFLKGLLDDDMSFFDVEDEKDEDEEAADKEDRSKKQMDD